jgi:hypothetical protein
MRLKLRSQADLQARGFAGDTGGHAVHDAQVLCCVPKGASLPRSAGGRKRSQ